MQISQPEFHLLKNEAGEGLNLASAVCGSVHAIELVGCYRPVPAKTTVTCLQQNLEIKPHAPVVNIVRV
jgi:hypothetical protein